MGYQVYYSYFQPVIGFVEHKEKEVGGGGGDFSPFLFFFPSLSLFRTIAPRDDGEEVELEAFVFQMKNPGRPYCWLD